MAGKSGETFDGREWSYSLHGPLRKLQTAGDGYGSYEDDDTLVFQ